MQAHFLLGPAGSGKTFRCLAEIRAALAASPEGPPLVLLAPKQATFQLERQLLADGAPARLHALEHFFIRAARAVCPGCARRPDAVGIARRGRPRDGFARPVDAARKRIEIIPPKRAPPRFCPTTQPVARRTATASIHARQTSFVVPAHRPAPRTSGQTPRPRAAARRLHALARRTRIAGRKPIARCGDGKSQVQGPKSKVSGNPGASPSSIVHLHLRCKFPACGSTVLRK